MNGSIGSEEDRSAGSQLRDILPGVLAVLADSDVCEFDVREGDIHIRIHRSLENQRVVLAAPPAEYQPESLISPAVQQISAPLVGTFYRAGQPGMPPLVAEGARVHDETVVGIIEAMHVLTEIEAGYEGTISQVLATDGMPVEYGQVLFEVIPGE